MTYGSRDLLEEIWRCGGGDLNDLESVALTGNDAALPSSFRVGGVAQGTIAAAARAATRLHETNTGLKQSLSVDMNHAAIEFLSERNIRVDRQHAPRIWDSIAGVYECGDGRWIRLHTNFDHHRQGVLDILKCDYDRDAVASALKNFSAFDVEDQAAKAGVVSYAMRTTEEWEAHPQGQAVDLEPLVSIEKIADADPIEHQPGNQPMSGYRVLDLTRIIAGPVCGRTLAVHGADVMRIAGPHLPFVPVLVMDAGRGKRSAYLDFRQDEDKQRLRDLLGDANVFVQGYRPGAIAGQGFDPVAVAQLRPGIVYVSLCAWGYSGPWADRRGYDSLVQTASGINLAESEAAGESTPGELPCQALDHASGYLMAFGAMRALERQRTEGGSWHVRVSLARTGRWIQNAGRIPDGHRDHAKIDPAQYLQTEHSGFGELTYVSHAAKLDATPPRWRYPSTPLGVHKPDWSVFDAT